MPYKYYPQATKFEPTTSYTANAFLDELFACKFDNTGKHSIGFYSIKTGEPLSYECETHEIKLVLEGAHEIEDETGQKKVGTAGDLFFLEKGSKVTFRPVSEYSKGFYMTQHPEETKASL